MHGHVHKSVLAAVSVLGAAAFLPTSGDAGVPEVTEPPYFSGDTVMGQWLTVPASDDVTGNTVFVLTPQKAPADPTNTNPTAQKNQFYLVYYPVKSTIPAGELDCQTGAVTGVGNCFDLRVFPFYISPTYDSNPGDANGTSAACVHWNGGQPCTVYLGRDRLISVPSTGGDVNVVCQITAVFFTVQAFADGAINKRIRTVNQVLALAASGDVVVVPTGSTFSFNCSIVPQATYARGSPLSYAFP
jgi:hypothetical protein